MKRCSHVRLYCLTNNFGGKRYEDKFYYQIIAHGRNTGYV